jgi:hypothetical protein
MWADEDFTALTEAAQRAYMLALSQPGLNYCGVVPFTLKRWANLAADSTIPKLHKAFTALQAGRFVVVDEDSEELLFRTFVKHDGILESPNICKASAKAFPTIHSRLLRGVFLAELHRLSRGDQQDGWDKGWPHISQLLSEPLPEGLPEGFHQRFCVGIPESRAGACPCPSPCPDPSPVPGVDGEGHEAFRRVRDELQGRTA